MYCGNCGNQIPDQAKFCTHCGHPTGQAPDTLTDTQPIPIPPEVFAKPSSGEFHGAETPAKSKTQPLVILLILLFVVAISGGYMIWQNQKLKESDAVALQLKMEQTKKEQEEALAKQKTDEATAAEKAAKEKEAAEKTAAELAKIEEEIAAINEDKVDLMGYNLTSWTSVEKDRMLSYVRRVDELTESGDLEEAKAVLEEWGMFYGLLERSGETISTINSIDVNSFPLVTVYISLSTLGGEPILLNDPYQIQLYEEGSSGNYEPAVIESAVLLSGRENLNVALVADISASMSDYIRQVKTMMNNFVSSLDYSVGDAVCFITFNTSSYLNLDYTDSLPDLQSSISGVEVSGRTALYDALYGAVGKSTEQSGAKCVIAYTDGIDNESRVSAQQVIDLANQYHIPIFIIGMGTEYDDSIQRSIAESTGGSYVNIDYGEDLTPLYNQIYSLQKGMYAVDYQTNANQSKEVERNLYLSYLDSNRYACTSTRYTPALVEQRDAIYRDLLQKPISQSYFYTDHNGTTAEMRPGDSVPEIVRRDVLSAVSNFLYVDALALQYKDSSYYSQISLSAEELASRIKWIEGQSPREYYTIDHHAMIVDTDSFEVYVENGDYVVSFKEKFSYTEALTVDGQTTYKDRVNSWKHILRRPVDAEAWVPWTLMSNVWDEDQSGNTYYHTLD
ncbi:MAG: VWA domain-containing protein [Tissierellia bacterium]|nr:VWA domain-containing protein [Tissierellia bacterium]